MRCHIDGSSEFELGPIFGPPHDVIAMPLHVIGCVGSWPYLERHEIDGHEPSSKVSLSSLDSSVVLKKRGEKDSRKEKEQFYSN